MVGAQAVIIDINSIKDGTKTGVAAGALAYIGDADGSPTPHQVGGPLPQTVFSPTDPIRIAQSIDLASLDINKHNSTDVVDGELLWEAWDDDNVTVIPALVWLVDWYDPNDNFVDFNLTFISWADITAWQADPNLTQLALWTDLWVPEEYGPLMTGTWNADIFFEGEYHSTATFNVVPEPVSLSLMLMGLLMLCRRGKRV